MAIVNTLKIYESLKSNMNEPAAKAVSEAIEQSLEEYRQNQKEFLATKEDMANLRAEIMRWMIAFFITQATLILGLYAAILLKK